MNSSLLIRQAEERDAEIIADFNLRLALETEHLRLDPATVRSGVEAVLKDPAKGIYFVADVEGQAVGQCSITYEWSDWRNGMYWWLQSVYVEPNWRRRGAFRLLFDYIRESARSAGVIGLRLYVEKDNVAAQAVYNRHGLMRTHYLVCECALQPGPPG